MRSKIKKTGEDIFKTPVWSLPVLLNTKHSAKLVISGDIETNSIFITLFSVSVSIFMVCQLPLSMLYYSKLFSCFRLNDFL